jgi:4-amino-4-deoxy-L-arabinose transferase-like glycosyltransferase
MKKSTIRWSVLLGVLCILFIENIFTFKSIPLPFKPNWVTIIPALAMCAAGVGVLIHKELAASKPRTRKATAELAMACTASAAR